MKARVLPYGSLGASGMERFPLEGVREGGLTDFDLYLEIGGHMVLYAPSPYHWSAGEVARLKADGYVQLYYGVEDAARVTAYRKLAALGAVNPKLPPRQRLSQITDIASEFTKILFEHSVTPASLAKGQEIAEALVQCVDEDPACVQALGRLAEHDQYTFYHSARVAAYALAIAIRMGEKNKSNLRDIAMGCLLHDIGKSKIDAKIINKNEPLTEREWVMMRKHPQLGADILSSQNLVLVTNEIVLHHHERNDGKGYPHGLTKHEILPEVTIAAFSDVFDALTTNRPYQRSRTKYEALDFIRFHLLHQFFEEPYKIMVELLSDKKDKAS